MSLFSCLTRFPSGVDGSGSTRRRPRFGSGEGTTRSTGQETGGGTKTRTGTQNETGRLAVKLFGVCLYVSPNP